MLKMPSRLLFFFGAFLLTLGAISITPSSQEDASKHHSLRMPESWARKAAITKVMPTYPEEAATKGVQGIVHIKFEASPEGEVLRVKVKPRTNTLLTKAVAAAVKQWKFKPWLGPLGVSQPVISRLIFSFSLVNGEARVQMFDPGLSPPDEQSLGYYNSAKEMREWRDWEEVSIDQSTP